MGGAFTGTLIVYKWKKFSTAAAKICYKVILKYKNICFRFLLTYRFQRILSS